MNLWLELLLVCPVAIASVMIGRWLGRGGGWWAGFVLSLLAVALVIVGHRSVALSFVPPISWTMAQSPLLMAAAAPALLSTLIVRLPQRRQRLMVSLLMVVMTGYYAIFPALLPLVVRGSLAATPTVMGRDHVCRQTHAYTCGPAAAVTCLDICGIHAEEGPLAIAAPQAAPAMGTDGWMLAGAVAALYGKAGAKSEYRYVGRLDNLRVPAVAAIWSPQYGGHFLAVLEVEADGVVVGDPLSGRYRMTRKEFLEQWSGAAVEIGAKGIDELTNQKIGR